MIVGHVLGICVSLGCTVGFVCLLSRVLLYCGDVCGSCVHKHFVGSACGVESPRASDKGTAGC